MWSTAPGLLLFCLQFGGRRLTTPLEALVADVSRPLCRVHPAVSPPPLIRAGRVPEGQFARLALTWRRLLPAQCSGGELGFGGCSVGTLRVAVADRTDLEFTHSLIDRIFRLSLGELADFSGAKYDGDLSLSLEDAQRRKHEYVAERIGIGPGRRLLDLGCGWGPLLAFVRECGGEGVGVTLSSAQAESCRRQGLDVHLIDVREVGRDTFGCFDAVASLGAFEHFCSPADYRAGRQDDVYRDVFARAASVLSDGGRLYLQTMVFGRNMIPVDAVSIHAPPDSDA